MFNILDKSQGNVLGVEITGPYTKEDEAAFQKAFEDALQGHDKINILVKIDKMDIGHSSVGAIFKDSHYALKNITKFGHLSVVGNSAVEKALVTLDNKLLGNPAKGRIEKYFDAADLDAAWAFVNE